MGSVKKFFVSLLIIKIIVCIFYLTIQISTPPNLKEFIKTSDGCICETNFINQKFTLKVNSTQINYQVGNLIRYDPNITYDKPKLAVIVPYRNCFEELLLFAPHVSKFLSAQKIPHHIFVTNHLGNVRFNKGAMINVAYLYEREKFDYLVVHDIDTLPVNSNLCYDFPEYEDSVFHVSAPWLHPNTEYNFPQFLGGVVIISNKGFEKVNGFTNMGWGWGLEDDEFRDNILLHNFYIGRPLPSIVSTGHNDTFLDTHTGRRTRDSQRCFNELIPRQNRFENDGADSTKYNITDIKELTIDGAMVTILNVEYACDRNLTPWCDCSQV